MIDQQKFRMKLMMAMKKSIKSRTTILKTKSKVSRKAKRKVSRKAKRKVSRKAKRKRVMNAYMIIKEKARKGGKKSFMYKGNKYVKSPTSKVIYTRVL